MYNGKSCELGDDLFMMIEDMTEEMTTEMNKSYSI